MSGPFVLEFPAANPSDELWALDLDRDGLPWAGDAHQIVADDGRVRTSACGREFTEYSHPKGWWGFRPDEGLIHCEAPK